MKKMMTESLNDRIIFSRHWKSALGFLFLSVITLLSDAASYPDSFEAVDVKKKSRPEICETVPGTLWVDAEDFQDYGGWYHDTQFVYLMGSGYLMAQGVGTPVEDAVATVRLKEAGTYRLWVRSRNWDVEHSPGRFQVLVDGAASETVFGHGLTEQWSWDDGGTFALTAGEHELRLMDLTGYYGRCDVLVLTKDLGYRPPEGSGRIANERSRLTGLNMEPVVHDGFDVIVVGGGTAGTSAAIAAARNGAKTALIQDRPVLGGNTSAELVVSFQGPAAKHAHMHSGGIAMEACLEKAHGGFHRWSAPWHKLADAEANLTVFLNNRVDGVVMDGESCIKGVRALHALDGTRAEYHGRLVVDATGDGWVGYYAGADYRLGREARHEFNESEAPVLADRITMSGCLMGKSSYFSTVQRGVEYPFVAPIWASRVGPDFEDTGRLYRRLRANSGGWWLEYPGYFDDLWKAEEARDYLYKITYGYFDFIKNQWSKKETAKPYMISDVPPTLARRESRRLLGDYIWTQNDAMEGRGFDDAICHSGWNLDVHHPRGFFSGAEGSYQCDHRVPVGQVPYRCIYSRNIDNLFMAGRCVSVTHVGLGSLRISQTCSTMGQAAGTAAAMCAASGQSPRELGQTRIGELQQRLLRWDQYIPDVTNTDPADLARKATVRASSVSDCWEIDGSYYERPNTLSHQTSALDHAFLMCPTGRERAVGIMNFWVESAGDTDEEVTLNVYAAHTFKAFDALEPVTTIKAVVPAGHQGEFAIPVNTVVDAPYVVFDFDIGNDSKLLWKRSSSMPPQFAVGVKSRGAWEVYTRYIPAIYFNPPLQWAYDFSADKIMNGKTRCLGTEANMWRSDPDQSLPQWVELTWDKAQTIREVDLVFDSNLDHEFYPREKYMHELVRDYDIQVCREGRWNTVQSVTDNYQRLRMHRFDPVEAERVRIVVSKTGGAPSAHIFEVRVY